MSKRPNPVKGKTVVHQDPNLVFTREDMRQAIIRSRLDGKREYMEHLGITKFNTDCTPANRWFLEGKEDDFPKLIDQERGSLALGNHTDDELASELFIFGDMTLEDKHRAMITGKPTSIAYLTAGKERILWLSRHLTASLASEKVMANELQQIKETSVNKEVLWNWLLKDYTKRLQSVLGNDKETLEAVDAEFIANAGELLSEATLLNKVHGLYERFAIIIYNKWNKDPSFVEWVPYGNSSMQSKARVLARNEHLHAIVKTLSKGE